MRRLQELRAAYGFTLIELLIVIAIIGILTAVLVPNLVGMRQRAQDSQTKSNLRELKTALRLYYNDFQYYPTYSTAGIMEGCVDGTENCTPGDEFTNGSSVYMPQLPSEFYYARIANSPDAFIVCAPLNNLDDPELSQSQAECWDGSFPGTFPGAGGYSPGSELYCECSR